MAMQFVPQATTLRVFILVAGQHAGRQVGK